MFFKRSFVIPFEKSLSKTILAEGIPDFDAVARVIALGSDNFSTAKFIQSLKSL